MKKGDVIDTELSEMKKRYKQAAEEKKSQEKDRETYGLT